MPRAGTREHQVRRVGADGDQNQEHDALQRRERAGDHLLRPAGGLPVGQHLRRHRAVARRIGPGEIARHAIELGLRLGHGRPARQTSHHGIAAALARIQLLGTVEKSRRERGGHEHREVESEDAPLEMLRRDADDREVGPVDPYHLPDRAGCAVEPRRRQAVRDDEHGRIRGSADLVRSEEPSRRGPQAERAEEAVRDELPVHPLVARGCAHIERHHPSRQEALERLEPLAVVLELQPRRPGIGTGFRPRLDEVEMARVRNPGQRLQHDRLEPGEDDQVHADADAKRQDHDRGQQPHARDRPESVPHVATEMFQPEHGDSSKPGH